MKSVTIIESSIIIKVELLHYSTQLLYIINIEIIQ